MSSEEVTQQEVDDELHACARYGELDDLKLMCDSDDTGPMVQYDVRDGLGSSAMHKAAANGHLAVLEYLVAKGSKYQLNDSGAGPLHWAILNKQFACALYLLKTFTADIDVLATTPQQMSLVSMAYEAGDAAVLSAVLVHDSAKALDATGTQETCDEEVPDEDEGVAEDAGADAGAGAGAGAGEEETSEDASLASEVKDKLSMQ